MQYMSYKAAEDAVRAAFPNHKIVSKWVQRERRASVVLQNGQEAQALILRGDGVWGKAGPVVTEGKVRVPQGGAVVVGKSVSDSLKVHRVVSRYPQSDLQEYSEYRKADLPSLRLHLAKRDSLCNLCGEILPRGTEHLFVKGIVWQKNLHFCTACVAKMARTVRGLEGGYAN